MELDVNAFVGPLIWAFAVCAVVGVGLGVIRDILFDAISGRDGDDDDTDGG